MEVALNMIALGVLVLPTKKRFKRWRSGAKREKLISLKEEVVLAVAATRFTRGLVVGVTESTAMGGSLTTSAEPSTTVPTCGDGQLTIGKYIVRVWYFDGISGFIAPSTQ